MSKQCFWEHKHGEGWGYCKYGDGVKCDDEGVDGKGCTSWICPEAVEKGQKYLKKEQSKRKFEDLIQTTCGTISSNPSPLQAFLTDCLKGFTCPVLVDGESGSTGSGKDGKKYQDKLKQLRSGKKVEYLSCYPEFLSHRGHATVPGTECAVPMGFTGCFKKKEGSGGTQAAAGQGMIGVGINAVLNYYANDDISSSGLYQITRCICSLTRRVPRSTGTLYGFFYSIGGMCKKNYSDKGKEVSKALSTELLCCPGWRKPDDLMDALFNWRGVTHNNKDKQGQVVDTSTIAGHHDNGTLDSLHKSGGPCNTANASCGYYLRPITGYLYNSLATPFCETYVSWIVHLTWRLQSGLEKLLEEFKGIKCTKDTCKGRDGKTDCKCPEKGCRPGTHDQCHCEYIVFCGGVLGLFYRFGFTFFSPIILSGTSKRDCKQFYERLETVIKGKYFENLFKEIRKFIYSTRALFGLYIGVYWSIVLLYLLWSMTVNLDLIHIQSHWKSPGSYLVPVGTLLSNGSRNVKGVCTIGYFQENTGDRLLSQGVSDVYL